MEKEKSCSTCIQCTASFSRNQQPIAAKRERNLWPINLHSVERTASLLCSSFSWFKGRGMIDLMAKVTQSYLFVLQSFPPHPPSSCIWFLFYSLLLYPPTAFFDLCSMWLQFILHHLQKADVITAGPLCLFKPVISWEEALSNCNTAAAKIKFHCQVWRRPQTLINGRSKQKQIFTASTKHLEGLGQILSFSVFENANRRLIIKDNSSHQRNL